MGQVKRIRERTKYLDKDTELEYTFDPVEDTLQIVETPGGYVAGYLTMDEDAPSPDEWENKDLFLVHYHRQFWIERADTLSEDDLREIYQTGKHDSLMKEYHVFPVAALIHGGVWLSLGSRFDCDPGGWDTSHSGAILVSKKEWRLRKSAEKAARSLLSEWNTYLSGDVYCTVVETYDKNKAPIDFDTVGGMYGSEYAKQELKGLIESEKEAADKKALEIAAALVETPAETIPGVEIVIHVEGGLVQAVYAAADFTGKVDVIDMDNLKVDADIEAYKAGVESLEKAAASMKQVC